METNKSLKFSVSESGNGSRIAFGETYTFIIRKHTEMGTYSVGVYAAQEVVGIRFCINPEKYDEVHEVATLAQAREVANRANVGLAPDLRKIAHDVWREVHEAKMAELGF